LSQYAICLLNLLSAMLDSLDEEKTYEEINTKN